MGSRSQIENQHAIVLHKKAIAKFKQAAIPVKNVSVKYAAITSRKSTGQDGAMCIKHDRRILR